MIELINSTGIYFWIIVLVAMIFLEATTVSLTTIWFATGALFALIVCALGGSVALQWAVFAISSVLLLVVLRPFTKNVLKVKKQSTNADRIIDQKAIVIETIDNSKETGQVKLMGQFWSARSLDNQIIEEGSEVIVRSISGVKAIVQLCNDVQVCNK